MVYCVQSVVRTLWTVLRLCHGLGRGLDQLVNHHHLQTCHQNHQIYAGGQTQVEYRVVWFKGNYQEDVEVIKHWHSDFCKLSFILYRFCTFGLAP